MFFCSTTLATFSFNVSSSNNSDTWNPIFPYLQKEIDSIVSQGVPKPNILVSDRAQILMPYHIDFDAYEEEGSVSIIFQIVGQTTMLLSQMNEGDCLLDFVGPLGAATEFGHIKKACVIGGGVGNAIAYPSAKALFNMGVDVDVIAGFRSKDIVILEDEYKEVCNRLFITTDDRQSQDRQRKQT